jgi:predicted PurR-regulated permease PerM
VRRRLILSGIAIVVALAAVLLAMRIPRTVTIFGIAGFIALGVHPTVAYLGRFMKRGLAITIVFAGLLGALGLLAVLVIPATIEQMQILSGHLPEYVAATQNFIVNGETFVLRRFGATVLPTGTDDLHTYIAARATEFLNAAVASAPNLLINTGTGIFIALSAIVLSAFLLARGDVMAATVYRIVPKHRRATAQALGAELARVFGGYVAGQVVLCAITGLLIFAACLAAGFKFALLIAVFSGLAYAVPFFGMLVAQIVALVLAAPQGVAMMIWVSVILFVVARVSDTLLVPKVMAESLGVSPVVVMFAVFAGGELFGLPGLLLGIPAAALIKVVWRFFREWMASEQTELAAVLGGDTSEPPLERVPDPVAAGPARPSTSSG